MAYLTYEEYKESEFTEIDEAEFDRLLKRASEAVDSETCSFYRFNDLEEDVPFRREQFKKAVACQIEYFHDLGTTTTHGMEEDASVTIGRTNLSKGARASTAKQESTNYVSVDAIRYLQDTGLLYRGIGVMG